MGGQLVKLGQPQQAPQILSLRFEPAACTWGLIKKLKRKNRLPFPWTKHYPSCLGNYLMASGIPLFVFLTTSSPFLSCLSVFYLCLCLFATQKVAMGLCGPWSPTLQESLLTCVEPSSAGNSQCSGGTPGDFESFVSPLLTYSL